MGKRIAEQVRRALITAAKVGPVVVAVVAVGLVGTLACSNDEASPNARCPFEGTKVRFRHAYARVDAATVIPTCPVNAQSDQDGGPLHLRPDGSAIVPPCTICHETDEPIPRAVLERCVDTIQCGPTDMRDH